QDILLQVHLDGVHSVLERGEGGLAEPAQGGHPAGDGGGDGLLLERVLGRRAVARDEIAGAVLHVELPTERIDPQTSKLVQLLEPLGDLVVQFFHKVSASYSAELDKSISPPPIPPPSRGRVREGGLFVLLHRL